MASINRQFWGLPIFAGLSLAYALWLKESVLWFLFYVCLACMALAMVYRWRNWSKISVSRSFITREYIIEAGGRLRIALWAEVSSHLPWPWLELRDNLPSVLEKNLAGESVGYMAWARKGSVQYATYIIKDIPRGIHTWDKVTINSGDPLGLVTYTGSLNIPNQLVVYPRTIELPVLNFFPRRVEGAVSTKKIYNQGLTELMGVRDYRYGDRLSLIHWKSTAKNNQLYSKEFEPLQMESSLIVLDCTIGSWKGGEDPAFEEAVTVGASLAKAAVLQRIPARFYSNHGKGREQMAVGSRAEYNQLLLHLAAIAPTGRYLLRQGLYRELSIQDNNVVIVTSQAGENLGAILHHLSVRGNAVSVIQVGDTSGGGNERPLPYKVYKISKAEDLQIGLKRKEVN